MVDSECWNLAEMFDFSQNGSWGGSRYFFGNS